MLRAVVRDETTRATNPIRAPEELRVREGRPDGERAGGGQHSGREQDVRVVSGGGWERGGAGDHQGDDGAGAGGVAEVRRVVVIFCVMLLVRVKG